MESGSARYVKEEAVGLPSLSVSGVDSRDKTFPLVRVFRPLDKRGTFGNNSIWVGNRQRKLWAMPQCEGQCLGVLHVLWSQESLVPSRTMLRLRHRWSIRTWCFQCWRLSGCPVNFWRRLRNGFHRQTAREKEGTYKLDKEKKHLERLASHAEKKRQEAEEALQKHAVKQLEVDALELEVEQARIKAVVPTPVPSPPHVTPVPSLQQSDAESTVNEEGAISDFDLAFGDDRGSIKKPKVDHPPQKRIPLAPPNPRDIESAVNGGNYQLEDLRKLRDLVDEKMKTQASSSQLVPLSG